MFTATKRSVTATRAHLSQSWTKISFIIISKWFEPKSTSSLSSVIVRVSVVLKRPVGDSD